MKTFQILFLSALSAGAAVPSFESFDTNYFRTNGYKVSLNTNNHDLFSGTNSGGSSVIGITNGQQNVTLGSGFEATNTSFVGNVNLKSGSYNGNGTGLTNLNASNLRTGVAPVFCIPDLSGVYLAFSVGGQMNVPFGWSTGPGALLDCNDAMGMVIQSGGATLTLNGPGGIGNNNSIGFGGDVDATNLFTAHGGIRVTGAQDNTNRLTLRGGGGLRLSTTDYLTLSNATTGRMLLLNSDRTVTNIAASGASPANADGSATTFAQVDALSGSLSASHLPALTGAITTSAGSAATSLGSFSSANLATALTDESGNAGVFPRFNLTSVSAGQIVAWDGNGWTNGAPVAAGPLPGNVHTQGMSVVSYFANPIVMSNNSSPGLYVGGIIDVTNGTSASIRFHSPSTTSDGGTVGYANVASYSGARGFGATIYEDDVLDTGVKIAGVGPLSKNFFVSQLIVGGTNGTIFRTTQSTPLVFKATSYTVTILDSTVLVDTSSGNQTITLPASPRNGMFYRVMKTSSDSNTLTLSGNSKSINGTATKTTTTQYVGWLVQYDSNTDAWYVVP